MRRSLARSLYSVLLFLVAFASHGLHAETRESRVHHARHESARHPASSAESAASASGASVPAAPASTNSDSDSGGFVGFLVMVGLGVTVLVVRDRKRTKRKHARVAQLAKDAEAWAESIRSTGKLPPTDTGTIIVPKGELAVLAEPCQLYELKADSTRHYLGTRVKIGNMPVYLGGSKSTGRKVLTATASGMLALTDKTLLFAGPARTTKIKVSEIVGVEPAIDSILVSSGRHATPFLFAVSNPFKWLYAIKLVTAGGISATGDGGG